MAFSLYKVDAKAISRLKTQKTILLKAWTCGISTDYLAIAVVESKMLNNKNSGVWMLTKSTARKFGLKVNKKMNERKDIFKSTKAACKYLRYLEKKFKSEDMALLAYNMGEGFVEQGISETQSKDASTLIENGYYNDEHYLEKIHTVIKIINSQKIFFLK